MNRKKLSYFIFLLLSLNAFAQADYRSGYVIDNKQDTLFGAIDYRKDELMGEQV